MLEIDSIVTGIVENVTPYGIFLKFKEHTIVVLLPEIAWHPVKDPEKVLKVGECVDVLILRTNYQSRQFVGSIRRLQQENNPYRALSHLEFGTVLQARVSFIDSVDVRVELTNRTYGAIPIHLVKNFLKNGDMIDVVITALDVNEGVLRLAPAQSLPM